MRLTRSESSRRLTRHTTYNSWLRNFVQNKRRAQNIKAPQAEGIRSDAFFCLFAVFLGIFLSSRSVKHTVGSKKKPSASKFREPRAVLGEPSESARNKRRAQNIKAPQAEGIRSGAFFCLFAVFLGFCSFWSYLT